MLDVSTHAYNISQEMQEILNTNPDLWNEMRVVLQTTAKQGYDLNRNSCHELGYLSLRDSLTKCESEINNLMHNENLSIYNHMSNAYMKLVYYAKKRGNSFDKYYIVNMLRAMKLNSSQAHQLFPCLLNKDIGGVHKDLFTKEVRSIFVS